MAGFSLIGGTRLRLTRMDACGRPAYGDTARLVTEGFISLTASANVDEGEAVTVTNANGKTCAQRRPKPKHNGYTVAMVLCGVDPDAINIMTGSPIVNNGSGVASGIDVDTDIDPSIQGVAVEVWSEIGESDELCAEGEGEQFGWVLLPYLTGGTLGDIEVGNDAVNFSVANATSRKGHSYGTGPYLVDVDSSGAPVALSPVSPSTALRVLKVGLAPPDDTVGAIPLDDPDSPEATGATAGTPGTFSPAGAFRPETVDDLAGVTATPLTAWTTGQGVLLQNGTFAYWDGAGWLPGKAA